MISITRPVGRALDRTSEILFRPFDIGKWFKLGFCCWLAYLLQGGGGPSGGNWTDDFGGSSRDVSRWVEDNLALILVVALVVISVLAAILLVLAWIQSRGKFMFLDGLARNRGAVVEPWKTYAEQGNSLFAFTILLAFVSLFVFLICAAAGFAIAWSDIDAGRFESAAWTGLLVGVGMLFVLGIPLAAVSFLLEQFVVPAMYLHKERASMAWRRVRTEVVAGHVGEIVLFFLMKVVLGIAITMIVMMTCCLTCCLVIVPYLGTVILLPLYVFSRSYTLAFLEQFGEGWRFFEASPVEPATAPDVWTSDD